MSGKKPLICFMCSKPTKFNVLTLNKRVSHIWLSAILRTVAHQASVSMGFSRQEYWSGLPFPYPLNKGNMRSQLIYTIWPCLLLHLRLNHSSSYSIFSREADIFVLPICQWCFSIFARAVIFSEKPLYFTY